MMMMRSSGLTFVVVKGRKERERARRTFVGQNTSFLHMA